MLQFLVVDDDDEVCDAVATGLEQYCGATVVRASNGATASQILRAHRLDFAVIDVMLPDMSGFELAERAGNYNVPALLISGHPKEQEVCKAHGYPHLDKPFPLRTLADMARHVINAACDHIASMRRSYASLTATLERGRRAAA
jgi:CheY-like chemotaxis protein